MCILWENFLLLPAFFINLVACFVVLQGAVKSRKLELFLYCLEILKLSSYLQH